MANIEENKKGFKIIQVSRIEMVDKCDSFGICDSCNETAETGFYIAVMNQWFCPKCYQNWYRRARRYPEDVAIENKNFEFYKKIFGI